MEEWIKKSDAIDAIHTYWIKRFETLPVDRDNNYLIDRYLEHNKVLCNLIKSIPSADRPQGEWTHRDSYWHTAICSNCNKLTMFEEWDEEIIEYDFCPNCGARMKGADDEV